MLIRSKAPLRLSFAGGGTDVLPFSDCEGGFVLNATITRYAWGTLTSRDDGQIQIESADFESLVQFDTKTQLTYDGRMGLAGGGGYILFYCRFERKHRVAEALRKLGA